MNTALNARRRNVKVDGPPNEGAICLIWTNGILQEVTFDYVAGYWFAHHDQSDDEAVDRWLVDGSDWYVGLAEIH